MAFFEFPNTRTYDNDLGWLIKDYHELKTNYDVLVDCCADVKDRLQALEDLASAIQSGDFPDSIKEAFESWMREHAIDLIGEIVTTSIFFGISDTGYFMAYMPGSWRDIIFNTTGLDIHVAIQPEYGHLVLSY